MNAGDCLKTSACLSPNVLYCFPINKPTPQIAIIKEISNVKQFCIKLCFFILLI